MSRQDDVEVDDVIDGNSRGRNDDGGDNDESFESEQGGFNDDRRAAPRGAKAFVLIVSIVGIVLVGLILYQHLGGNDNADEADSDPNTQPASASSFNLAPTPPRAEPPPTPQTAPTPPTPALAAANSSGGDDGEEKPLTPEEQAMQRRLTGFSTGSSDKVASASTPGTAPGSLGGKPSDDSKDFFKRLDSGEVQRAMASELLHPRMTVPQGTMILCGTTTELDTTVPGMVGCLVSRDVYSADGTVRLIDRGAHVTGLVGSGIQHGQNRVFVAWNRLRNPDNVVINLDSPGTNSLGSAGIPGQVDSHFWDRFGGAIFVSVLSDVGEAAVQAAGNAASSSNSSINLNQTSNSSQQLAREVLQHSLGIPPTLSVNQGTPVAIYVAKDLDFSNVYDLSMDQ